ncbi:MAG TPA: UvrD-helicase domain-containing protein [Thermoanaerobaculia bacterium]|nr:UvrD-helicase domain-containing protein [Thermoanaerobaculia bacterium]
MKPQQQLLPFPLPEIRREPEVGERRNLVIEAGAGTGKTTRIVREILSILLESPMLRPERIALLTFTEKAAAEIADRIRHALTDLHSGLERGRPRWPSDAGVPIFEIPSDRIGPMREACESHLRQLDRFRSQTIHSFCQMLIRQFPVEAGVNPSFSIIQGSELARFQDRVWSAWLREETKAGAPRAVIDQWEIVLQHLRGVDRIRASILALLSKRDLLADDSYSLGHISEAAPAIREAISAIRALPSDTIANLKEPFAHEIAGYLRSRRVPPDATLEEWIDYLAPIAEPLARVHRSRVGALREALKFLGGEGSGENRSTVHDQLAGHRAAVALRAMAVRFIARLDQEKLEHGVVDYDDLLLRALVLVENDRVVSELRKKFDYIFVDEFQDTDRVQARIIDRLARDDGGRLVGGKTVLVGDPKQAIYSFRRADPETYEQTVQTFLAEGAQKESLDRQYRSDPSLVHDINAMFAMLFSTPSSPNVARPLYRPPLIPARSSDGRSPAARITFIRERGSEDGQAGGGEETTHLQQGRAIAEWIETRRAADASSYGRFAILFRRMTRVEDYLDALERRGIPYALPPTRLFLDRRPSVDLLSVLAAVAAPSDRPALIGAARSPYFAIPDDEIVRYYLLPETEREGSTFGAFLQRIGDYAEESRHFGVAELIGRIIDDCDIEAWYEVTPGGGQSLLHLERLRDIAGEFDLNSGGSVADFVMELARRREEADEADASWIDEKTDAVKIMTVHAAKGLEFETVIIPDLSARVRNDQLRLFAIEEPRSLVLTGRLKPLAASFRFSSDTKCLDDICSDRLEAEMHRLFYVAVTRAKSDVVFACESGRQHNTGFWKAITSIFGLDPRGFEAFWPAEERETVVELKAGGTIVRALFAQIDPEARDEAGAPRFVHAAFERLAAEPIPPGLPARTTEPPPRLGVGEAKKLRAAARNRLSGTLLHRLLEVWDGESDPAALLETLAGEVGASPRDLERASRRVESLRSSSLLERLRRAETVGRELVIHYADEGGRLVEGRIDRLLREDGSWLVVDYKSGRRDAVRGAEDDEQVRAYCRAISSMTGGGKCRGVLWYLESDEGIEVGE